MQLRLLEYLVRKYYYEKSKSKQMRKDYRLFEQHRELLNKLNISTHCEKSRHISVRWRVEENT